MKLTKNNKNPVIKTLGVLIIISIIYSTLVISDYILFKYINLLTVDINKEAQVIEEKRYHEQDIFLKKEAEKDGFIPILLNPESFETFPVTKFIEQYKILPLAPRPYTKYYLCNEGYGLPKYVSDRFGFRNKDSIWDKEEIDIVLIGDSFTHGACVNEENSIQGLLSKKSYNVINLGTLGNGPMHMANISTTFIESIKPKYVILIIGPNDNSSDRDNIYNKFFPQKGSTYFENYSKNSKPKKISKELNKLYKEAYPFVYNLINNPAEKLNFFEGNIFKRGYKYLTIPNIRKTINSYFIELSGLKYSTKLLINTIAEECENNNCEPLIVYLPSSNFWRPDQRSPKYLKNIKKYISSLPTKLTLIDITEEIYKNEMESYAIEGPHLSPKGYKILVDNILRQIN